MLAVLRGAGLTDTVAVVVRWFGGTKLGKGGLVRAYGGALRAALEALPTVEVRVRDRLSVALPYERLGAVKRLLQPPAVELAAERYGAAVELDLDVEPGARAALEAALADLGLAARAR
jgi:putative IMPACT (imprinted ancient) family translation regulator